MPDKGVAKYYITKSVKVSKCIFRKPSALPEISNQNKKNILQYTLGISPIH